MQRQPDSFEPLVCATAQHRDMLDQMVATFQIKLDWDLNIMTEGER